MVRYGEIWGDAPHLGRLASPPTDPRPRTCLRVGRQGKGKVEGEGGRGEEEEKGGERGGRAERGESRERRESGERRRGAEREEGRLAQQQGAAPAGAAQRVEDRAGKGNHGGGARTRHREARAKLRRQIGLPRPPRLHRERALRGADDGDVGAGEEERVPRERLSTRSQSQCCSQPSVGFTSSAAVSSASACAPCEEEGCVALAG